MKNVKRKSRKDKMASLSGKNSDLYIRSIEEAILNSATLHRVPTNERCPICGRALDTTRQPIVFFEKVIYAHLECIISFSEYLSVELLDPPVEIAHPYEIISTRMVIAEEMLTVSNTSIFNHIGISLGSQLATHLNSTCMLHDVRVNIDRDFVGMQVQIQAQAKLDHTCMFCSTGRRLVLPPQAAFTWKGTDEIPMNEVMAREEELLITNDKKYKFHQSCLNEIVAGLQRFTN
jgi:hypothetical protein